MGKSADELLAIEWWRDSDADFLSDLRDIETLSRRLNAKALQGIADAQARGLVERTGYQGLTELLRDTLRITRTEAKRRIAQSDAVGRLSVLADALPDGLLGSDHIDVIRETVAALPDTCDLEQSRNAESRMVAKAAILDAHALRREGRHLNYEYDQDGPEPNDEPLRRSVNEFSYHVGRHGKLTFRGVLEPEIGAAFTALLSPLAKPRPVEGLPDLRCADERYGDALAELVLLAANAAKAPVEGGQRPHITVTMSLAALREGVGAVSLGDSGALSAADARRIACDATVIPAVLGSASEVLDIGRSHRTIPAAIRRAVVLRDGGCAFPGCERRAGWSDCHHVRHWADGGTTEVDNLVVVCRLHHQLMHHSPWQVRIRNGLPEFIPPAFVDPRRTPRRNSLHRNLVRTA